MRDRDEIINDDRIREQTVVCSESKILEVLLDIRDNLDALQNNEVKSK